MIIYLKKNVPISVMPQVHAICNSLTLCTMSYEKKRSFASRHRLGMSDLNKLDSYLFKWAFLFKNNNFSIILLK